METVATMARENSGTSPKLRTYAGIRGVTLAREVRENGGATIDLDSPTLALTSKTNGYFVGGATKPLTAPIADVDTRHYQYALKTLSEAQGGTGYAGFWVDGSTLYAEGSTWFFSRAIALRVARMRGEIAIYDVANQTDITL